jgi:hypothetical protein
VQAFEYATAQNDPCVALAAVQHVPSTGCGHVVAPHALALPMYVPPGAAPTEPLATQLASEVIRQYTYPLIVRQHAPSAGCAHVAAAQAVPSAVNDAFDAAHPAAVSIRHVGVLVEVSEQQAPVVGGGCGQGDVGVHTESFPWYVPLRSVHPAEVEITHS